MKNRRGHTSLRTWLMGAAAVGVPTAMGMIAVDQAAFADGKLPFGINTKKPAAKASEPAATEPPRLLPMTDEETTEVQAGSSIQTAAASNSEQKSEIMKQLELLYEQDGREMPDLPAIQPNSKDGAPATTSTAPAYSGANQRSAASQPAAQPNAYRNSPPITGQRVASTTPAPSNKNPVTGFFKKLMPGSKDSKPAAPATTAKRPATTNGLPQTASSTPARANEYAPAQVRMQPSAGSFNSPNQAANPQVNSRVAAVPAIAPTQTPALSNDLPPSPASDFALDLPAPSQATEATLPGLQSQPLPALASEPFGSLNAEPGLTSVPPSEVPEEIKLEDVSLNETEDPYTGLKLEDETKLPPAVGSASAPNPAISPATIDPNDPFAEELKKLGILPAPESAPSTTDSEPQLVLSSSDDTSLDGLGDKVTREKMMKIRERGGMKGLKGFCPVTLHDERELVDAKAEFHATHRGQKFHFASAEAKERFEQDPLAYAPAAYGADVVALTRDKDVVEGSLDHAAWFKGRLYLFGTKESHDTFVSNPIQYATPAGIE